VTETRGIEVVDVSLARSEDGRLRGFELAQPQPGHSDSTSFPVVGWALGRDARAVSVEIVDGEEVVARSPIDLPRPGLAQKFGDVPDGPAAGFRFRVQARGEGEGEVTMRVVLHDDTRVPVATVRARVSQPDARFTPLRWRLAPRRSVPAGPVPGAAASPAATPPAFAPDRLLWIFGSPRSGTTWLASMMGDMPGHEMWNEPLVGALFGNFYEGFNGDRQGRDFILAPALRDVWLPFVRAMVLTGAAARYEQPSESGYIVVKEPHGCQGAVLITQALPESRMIFLVRDPRDVASSKLDSQRQESWTGSKSRRWKGREKPVGTADRNPDVFIRKHMRTYVRDISVAKRAYESHAGPKTLLKYEELREDALGVMTRMYAELQVPVAREELAPVVERHSWEEVPAEKKGPGHFHRKATPGAWSEDLTKRQVEIVEEIAGPILAEFY
jgi:hypothetical protein